MKNIIKKTLVGLAVVGTLAVGSTQSYNDYVEKKNALMRAKTSENYLGWKRMWGIDNNKDGTVDKIIVHGAGMPINVRLPWFAEFSVNKEDSEFMKYRTILENNRGS